MRRISLVAAVFALLLGIAAAPRHLISNTASSPDFVNFESPHMHPMAITPDSARLLVVNTPDGYLTVYTLERDSVPVRESEIAVGLDPISVCALNDSIAWVVNHVSDDVSVVNLNLRHTVNTIRIGDEPGDVVFASGKAYVSVGGEDVVKVYDPSSLALLNTIPIGARMPMSLARDPSGLHVYVGNLMAGNRTTIMSPAEVPVDSVPEDSELPPDPGLPTPPHVGLIVQQQGNNWFDMYGNMWNSKVKYSMPDKDVSEINTAADLVTRSFSGIGSSIFNVGVNPTDGKILVLATEARNLLNFEPRLLGYTVETNLGVVNFATGVAIPRKLDPHIDYTTLPALPGEADSAIGIPTGISIDPGGNRAYVTSLATNQIAVCDPQLSNVVRARVPCVAGPTGVLVDPGRRHLYVLGRFHNQVQTLHLDTFNQSALIRLGNDPTPETVVNGRKFMYGGFTSAHGDQACASCHVFSDVDGLAWNLGDPLGSMVPPPVPNPLDLSGFHPMKGPMTTQTLRGMTNLEPFHWRGDRSVLSAFNGAFVSLLGRDAPLADSQMTAFDDFMFSLTDPPNPNQYLNRTFADAPPGQPSALRGREFFLDSVVFNNNRTCDDCHDEANFGPGSNREMVHRDSILEPQDLKVPQLRNLYRKVGFRDSAGITTKRGFGFSHDGSDDNLFRFLNRPQFTFSPDPTFADEQRRDMEAYLLAFDTGIAPAVGYELTFIGTNNSDPVALARVDTLKGQADLNYCDLVARGRSTSQPRGYYYLGADLWKPDKVAEGNLTTTQLIATAGDRTELTILGVPKGSGQRMGNDRDGDTYLDGDERDVLSDPGNFYATPLNTGVENGPGTAAPKFALRSIAPNPFRQFTEIAFSLGRPGRVEASVYDVLGRETASLARGTWFQAGDGHLRWDGRDRSGHAAAAGVYFVRVKTDAGLWTRPVVRLW